jgi:hypothetical protein
MWSLDADIKQKFFARMQIFVDIKEKDEETWFLKFLALLSLFSSGHFPYWSVLSQILIFLFVAIFTL